MTSNGNGTVAGATMSGLNTLFNATQLAAAQAKSAATLTNNPANATANGTKTFQYNSCEVAKAAGGWRRTRSTRTRGWTTSSPTSTPLAARDAERPRALARGRSASRHSRLPERITRRRQQRRRRLRQLATLDPPREVAGDRRPVCALIVSPTPPRRCATARSRAISYSATARTSGSASASAASSEQPVGHGALRHAAQRHRSSATPPRRAHSTCARRVNPSSRRA